MYGNLVSARDYDIQSDMLVATTYKEKYSADDRKRTGPSRKQKSQRRPKTMLSSLYTSRSNRDVSLNKNRTLTDNYLADDDDGDPPEDEGESGDEARPQLKPSAEVSQDEHDDPENADPDEPDVQQSPEPVASLT